MHDGCYKADNLGGRAAHKNERHCDISPHENTGAQHGNKMRVDNSGIEVVFFQPDGGDVIENVPVEFTQDTLRLSSFYRHRISVMINE